jgi:hypothetical protein
VKAKGEDENYNFSDIVKALPSFYKKQTIKVLGFIPLITMHA